MRAALVALILSFLLVANVGVAQLPSAVVPNGLSVQIHSYDENTFPLVQASGVKFVREDLTWWMTEWQAGSVRLFVVRRVRQSQRGGRNPHLVDPGLQQFTVWQ